MSHAMNLRKRSNRDSGANADSPTQVSRRTISGKPPKRSKNSYKPLQLASAFAPTYAARFPVDVWRMIVCHFESDPIRGCQDEAALYLTTELSPRCRERTDVLRALSQTCRVLRGEMLPLLWKHVETCSRDSEDCHLPMNKLASYVLRQHSLGLLRTPIVAGYVKSLTVSLLQGSSHSFLKQFTKCLASLPNLRGLRILDCDLSAEALTSAFLARCYPQIVELMLPAVGYPMLLAFPQITGLTVTRPRTFAPWLSDRHYGPKVYEAVIAHCHHLKSLRMDIFADYPATTAFDIVFPHYMQRLAEATPGLEAIMISMYVADHTPLELLFPVTDPIQQVAHFAQFPNLARVVLNVLPALGIKTDSALFKEKAQACFEILQKMVDSKSHGKPRGVVVRTWPSPTYGQSKHYELVDLASYQSESKSASTSIEESN